MTDTDIHSCGYYCDRPACIVAQRNELRDKMFLEQEVKTYSGGKPNYTQPEQVAQFKFQEYGPPNWGDSQVTKPEFVAEQKAMDEGLRKMVEQEEDYDAIANKQLASLKAAAKVTFEDAVVRAVHKLYNAPPQQPEQEIESDRPHVEDDGCPTEKAVLQRFWREHQKQEPVAWMHNFIDEVVIAHRPVDLARHPDRWTPLYKDPTPCKTCESLACTVMMDQTSHDTPPRHRELPTLDLSAPLTVNGVPMYPQREWQGLTDEEIENCFEMSMFGTCRAIEAKLREKNG